MAFLLRSANLLSLYTVPVKNIRCFSVTSFHNQLQEKMSVKFDQFDHDMRRIDSIIRDQSSLSKLDIEQAVESLKQKDSMSLNHSLNLLKACQSLYPIETLEVSRNVVSQVWNAISRCFVNLDISHFNALLQVYIEIGHQFSIEDFLSDLSNKGLEPNRVTLQLMIHKYCQDGNTDEAAKIVAKMKEKQMPVNRDIFNCFIMGYNKLGDIRSAEEIITLMKESGLEPSHSTYSLLMLGYAAQGNLAEIEDIALKCDVTLNSGDHLKIFEEMAVNGHEEGAINYLRSNVSRGRMFEADFRRCAIRLVNCGKEDTALLLLQVLSEESVFPNSILDVTTAYLKQLVKRSKPLNEILDICCKISSNNWCSFHTEVVLKEVIKDGDFKKALLVLNVMNENKIGELRSHYFWPLIIQCGNEKMIPEFQKLLSTMQEWNVEICEDTIRVLVSTMDKLAIPPEEMTTTFVNMLVERRHILNGFAMFYLSTHQLAPLVKVFQNLNGLLHGKHINNLVISCEKSNDAKNTALLVNYMMKSNVENENMLKMSRFFGRLLHPGLDQNLLLDLLKEMVVIRLGISKQVADFVRTNITEMTPEIEEIIEKLQAFTFDRSELKPELNRVRYDNASESLYQEYELRSAQDLPRDRIYVQTVLKCLEEKNRSILATLLKKDGVHQLKAGIFARIISVLLYEKEYVRDAFFAHKEMKRVNPDSFLHLPIMLNIATEISNTGQSEELINFLKEHLLPRSHYSETGSNISRILNSFFDSLANNSSNTIDSMKQINEIFSQNGFQRGNTDKYEILSLIQNGDLQAAVTVFKKLCEEKRAMVAKHQLQCALIKKEDSEMLQEVIEASMAVSNEMKSLHDLAISFLCCDRKLQAEKIFKSAGMQADNFTLEQQCRFLYRQEESSKLLEDMLEVTKDLFNCDRAMMYKYLLASYKKDENVDKVVEMWTSLQEENCSISDEFVKSLTSYLRSKNIILPFMKDEILSSIVNENRNTQFETRPKTPIEFKENYKETLKELFTSEKGISEITAVLKSDVFSGIQSSSPTTILRILIEKLDQNLDLESLKIIENKITGILDGKFCKAVAHCYIESGRAEELLVDLESTTIDEENQYRTSNLLNVELITACMDNEELLSKVNILSKKLQEYGNNRGYTSLLNSYLCNGNYEKADEILSTNLKDVTGITMNYLIKFCKSNKDAKPIEFLLNKIESSTIVQFNRKAFVESAIQILITKGELQQAADIYNSSKGDVDIKPDITMLLDNFVKKNNSAAIS